MQQEETQTITQNELILRVAAATQFTKEEVEVALGAVLTTIIQAVASGHEVDLTGFGTFRALDRKKRIGKNPKTGGAVIVDAKRLPRFQAGNTFKLSVNQVGQ